jgi:hypothetical protein
MNKGTEDRITFIFDYVPPGPLAYVPGQGKNDRKTRPAPFDSERKK